VIKLLRNELICQITTEITLIKKMDYIWFKSFLSFILNHIL